MKLNTFLYTILYTLLTVSPSFAQVTNPNDSTGVRHYVNFIKNPGGEKNVSNVTASAIGVLGRTTSSPIEGRQTFTLDGTASGQTVKWSTRTLDGKLKNGNCEASFYYSGDASLYKAYAEVGSTKYPTDGEQLQNFTDPRLFTITSFPCGDLTNSPKIVIETTSASAAAIKVDELYIGETRNIGTVQSPNIFATSRWVGTAGCIWTMPAASWTNIAADTDCDAPTVSGSGASAPATKIPGITFSSMAPGDYLFIATGNFRQPNGGYAACWRFSNGTYSTGGTCTSAGVGSEGATGTVVGRLSLTAPITSSTTFQIQGQHSGIAGTIDARPSNTFDGLTISVYHFPSQAQTAVRMDQTNYGYTDGGAVTITGTTSSPTKGTTSVDKIKFRRNGQKLEVNLEYRQTAAAGGSPAGSGDYLFAIPTSSGCTIDTAKHNAYTTVNDVFGMTNNVGSASVSFSNSAAGPGVVVVYDSTRFRIAAMNGATYRFLASDHYSLTNAVSYTANFSVYCSNWTENQNAPLIVGGVTSSSLGTVKEEYVSFGGSTSHGSYCTSSPCTRWDNTPAVTEVARTATGIYSITFASGTFSTTPSCSVTPISATGDTFIPQLDRSNTATTVSFRLKSTGGTPTDGAASVVCKTTR